MEILSHVSNVTNLCFTDVINLIFPKTDLIDNRILSCISTSTATLWGCVNHLSDKPELNNNVIIDSDVDNYKKFYEYILDEVYI